MAGRWGYVQGGSGDTRHTRIPEVSARLSVNIRTSKAFQYNVSAGNMVAYLLFLRDFEGVLYDYDRHGENNRGDGDKERTLGVETHLE